MSEFKFLGDEADEPTSGASSNKPDWVECKQISGEEVTVKENLHPRSLKCHDLYIKYLSNQQVIDDFKYSPNSLNSAILNAEGNQSDLVTGVYEGGLKIWECTFHLISYILNNNMNFLDKYVLDLGCGAGLVGLLTYLKGSRCTFQDYNEEVIRAMTIPNVLLNNVTLTYCNFYAGDWGSFIDLVEEEKFDYIFTSETIYNNSNYPKLINIFKKLLKPRGTIYLATKEYYYGVGGTLRAFEEALKDAQFTYRTVSQTSLGLKRTILKIEKKLDVIVLRS